MFARLQPHHRAGFVAGVAGGALVTAVMFALNRWLGLFSLAELAAYKILGLLPLSVFSMGVEALRGNAKVVLLASVALGQVLVAGLLGLLWASLTEALPGEARPGRRLPALWEPGPNGALLYALALFVLVEVALLPLLGGGFLGAAARGGAVAAAAVTALQAAIYGLTLGTLYRARLETALAAPGDAGPTTTRRQLLRQFALGLAALAVGGAALGLLTRRGEVVTVARPGGGRVGDGDLPPEVTPTEAFYQVSKNFNDPKVSEAGWTLEIGGMVERPYSLTLAEIRALPVVTDYRTLCCISNEVGGDLISNAGWKGVRVRDLLERAGVQPGAVDLHLLASDGYSESFPIARALEPDTLAVYEMNGEPLTDSHGFPLRLLVPDIYGMKNVKWVTQMNVVGVDIKGFWQERGWSDVAIVKTMSRFDFPRARQVLPPGPTRMGGVAFAGARGLAKVEVTADGGWTWHEGQVRGPLGPYTWVLWTAELDLPEGEHTLKVRATDGTGTPQTDQVTSPLPDGADGWHTISIRTAAGAQAPVPGQGGAVPPATPPPQPGIYVP